MGHGPAYVELVDGRIVSRDAEEWRHECLARHVMVKPLPERRAWLADFERMHGTEDAERLKATMAAVRAKARATA